ncbi:hypothetical protein [Hymenobacter volaticus]|uniref:Uncharacterized protein n=1 Tax=Hymenobacter volaticus TaxID=2932254 RepID=A0ABY4GEX6_9BACT|nr:hypothetical protein [Hymenobacter volaticus]UOQ69371.1 hypothetical protein MUN86_27145 [Hymenobacter volaticus]
MSTLDELKNAWAGATTPSSPNQRVDRANLRAIAQAQSTHHVNRAMQYFWASFTLQIIVYALLSHVFVRFWGMLAVQGLCLAGVLLYLPFTVVLLRQFKQVARASPAAPETDFSLQARTQQQYNSLRAFYRFKRRYEYLLVPLSTALGVWLTFRLYVPGACCCTCPGPASPTCYPCCPAGGRFGGRIVATSSCRYGI